MPINSFLYPGAKFIPGYEVANSCRFEEGDSAYMHITPGSAGHANIWTLSMWIKRSTLSTTQFLFGSSSSASNFESIRINDDDTLSFHRYLTTKQFGWDSIIKLRDPSAWYHLVFSRSGATQKYYINGVEGAKTNDDTSTDTGDFNTTDEHRLCHRPDKADGTNHFDGYMAEVYWIDGTAYDADDFGEFDEDSPTIWKPKDVSGLTFGTNGFYLDFEDSSNLGNDANGGTDLTEVNLAAADQATDTPTNNFCTMNPLENWAADNTFSEGNCVISGTTGAWQCSSGTMGFSKGKWYWELRYEGGTESYQSGVRDITANAFTTHAQNGVTIFYNARADNSEGGEMFLGSVGANTSEDFGTMNTSSDVLGVACNFDDGQISYYVNGSIMVTNHALDSTTDNKNTLFPFTAQYTTNVTKYNFGGCSGFTISSAASDANGYGVFEHAPPSGYYALCTKNLAEYG